MNTDSIRIESLNWWRSLTKDEQIKMFQKFQPELFEAWGFNLLAASSLKIEQTFRLFKKQKT